MAGSAIGNDDDLDNVKSKNNDIDDNTINIKIKVDVKIYVYINMFYGMFRHWFGAL